MDVESLNNPERTVAIRRPPSTAENPKLVSPKAIEDSSEFVALVLMQTKAESQGTKELAALEDVADSAPVRQENQPTCKRCGSKLLDPKGIGICPRCGGCESLQVVHQVRTKSDKTSEIAVTSFLGEWISILLVTMGLGWVVFRYFVHF